MNPQEEAILNRIKQARQAYLEKNFTQAIKHYKWVENQIRDDLNNLPIIWIELGWAYYNLKDYSHAIHFFEKALSSNRLTNDQRFDCLRLIGFSYDSQGNKQKAIHYLEQALTETSNETYKRFAYFELGKIYFILNNFEKAKPPLQRAWVLFDKTELDYKLSVAYYLGFIHYYHEEYDQAKVFFNNIIQGACDNKRKATGYFGMAHLFYKKKEFTVLIDACEKILALDKNFYDKETIGFFLCRAYMELKMWNELEDFFQELRKKYPEGRYKISYPYFAEALRNRAIPQNLKWNPKTPSA